MKKLTAQKDLIDCAIDVVDDAELMQIFEYRVWVSIDKYLWDELVNAIRPEVEERGDDVRCQACGYVCSIGGLVGENTNLCPKCGNEINLEEK